MGGGGAGVICRRLGGLEGATNFSSNFCMTSNWIFLQFYLQVGSSNRSKIGEKLMPNLFESSLIFSWRFFIFFLILMLLKMWKSSKNDGGSFKFTLPPILSLSCLGSDQSQVFQPLLELFSSNFRFRSASGNASRFYCKLRHYFPIFCTNFAPKMVPGSGLKLTRSGLKLTRSTPQSSLSASNDQYGSQVQKNTFSKQF